MSSFSKTVVISGTGIVTPDAIGIDVFTEKLKQGKSCAIRRKLFNGQTSVGYDFQEFSFENAINLNSSVPEELRNKVFSLGRRVTIGEQAALVAALEAWQSAQLDEVNNLKPIGLIISGNNLKQNLVFDAGRQAINEDGFVTPTYALRRYDTSLIGLISAALNLHGEGFLVGATSASGNAALIQGLRAVRHGYCDQCFVVGAVSELSPVDILALNNIGALAGLGNDNPAGEICRPFDENRSGFVPGQAAGCLVLESMEVAAKRGKTQQTTFAGGAISLDANSRANPNASGEANAMLEAMSDANVSAEQVDYINTHGSASLVGDETEIEAIDKVFGKHKTKLRLNATKALTGHCISSAGIIEAIATQIQMEHSFLHPNPNLEKPIVNDFNFIGKTVESQSIVTAVSNSFAFGGINTSIVLNKGK